MPRVIFAPSGKSVEVKAGTSLYDAAIAAELPVAASCSSEFACGKCNMSLLRGAESLSKQTQRERDLLLREKKPSTDRISCIAAVFGDCEATASYW